MRVAERQRKRLSAVAMLAVLGGYSSFATGDNHRFADDFSKDFVNLDFRSESRNLVDEVDPARFEAGQLILDIVDVDPTDDERGEFSLQPTGTLGSIESSVTTGSERPAAGRVGYSIQGRFYNSITDGGPARDDESLDRRYGDINVYVELYLHANPEDDNFLYCFESRTAEGGFAPAVEGVTDCSFLDLVPELNTTYTMTVGVDKASGQMFVRVNDEEVRLDAPTEMFEVASPYYSVRARVRDGASNARFAVNSITTNLSTIDLEVAAENGRYRTDDYDNFSDDESRDKQIVNEQLRLTSSNTDIDGDNDTFLRLNSATNYLEAEMSYSSDSDVVLGEGFAAVRIGGVLYNEFTSDPTDSMGDVWSSVMLIKNPDGVLVGEYCIARSDGPNFSVFTDLADGEDNDRCPTFDLEVEEDTFYTASIGFDADNKTLTLTLDGETKSYAITSDVFPRGEAVRAQSRIARGATGTVIGFFDNLRNDPGALTDEELSGAVSSGSGGGGGCTVGSGSANDPLLMLLLLLSLTTLVFRRQR